MCPEVPENVIAIIQESFFSFFMIDKDYHLDVRSPGDGKKRMRTIIVIRGHTMAPVQGNSRAFGEGCGDSLVRLMAGGFTIHDNHLIHTSDGKDGLIIEEALTVHLRVEPASYC